MSEEEDKEPTDRGSERLWFDEARVIDPEWIEIGLRTPKGNHVRYRIPRRTLFEKVDQAAR